MAPIRDDLLRGTLDTLILKTLSGGELHGYGIARWLESRDAALRIEEGSLYPALYRLEKRGWIEASWGTSELGRRVKFYSLTGVGAQQLSEQTERWISFSETISAILVGAEARAE